MNLGHCLSHSVRRFPDKPAIHFEDHTLTYRELDRRIHRLAASLARFGLGVDSKAAILGRNSHRVLELSMALARLGIWMVPINHRLRPADVDQRLQHAGVDALFIDSEFADQVTDFKRETLERLGPRIVVMGERPSSVPQVTDYETLATASPATVPEVDLSPEQPLYLGYTSGTTGRSKAAIVSHRAILAGFLYKALDYGLQHTDVMLSAGYFWHSAPRDFALLQLYLGGTTVVMRDFDAAEALRLLREHQVSAGFFVPTMYKMMLEFEPDGASPLASLRLLISGGAPMPVPLKKEVLSRFGPILHEFYGATETRVVASIGDRDLQARPRSVGRPGRDIRVRIVNENGASVPDGEIGQIYLQTPTLFGGYYRDPEKTNAAFVDNWFTLGDMGRQDPDGYLYLVDRRDDVILSGGENIYPSEIEEALLRHPAVSDAAVVGVPDERWGEAVKAFVCLRPERSGDVDEKSLKGFCREHLADYLVPKSFEFRDSLPRNPTGKILRRILKAPHWDDGGRPA